MNTQSIFNSSVFLNRYAKFWDNFFATDLLVGLKINVKGNNWLQPVDCPAGNQICKLVVIQGYIMNKLDLHVVPCLAKMNIH